MTRRLSTIAVISLLVFAFVAMSAFAANKEVPRVKPNPLLTKSVGYAFAAGGEHGNPAMAPKGEAATGMLGTGAPSASPGTIVGDTWYEYQRNGSMRRMIGFGPHSGGAGIPTVHFHWMYMPSEAAFGSQRQYRYNFYRADDGTFKGAASIQPNDEYAGYVSGDVTSDNRYVAAGHNNPGTRNSTHIYWDFAQHFATFLDNSRVPDTVQQYLGGFGSEGPTAQSTIWPAVAYQETGATPVTHVIAASTMDNGAAGDPNYFYYFRKVGANATGTWDYPPRVLDTAFALSQDIAASRTTQKIAIAYTANIPDLGDCDTCSNNNGQPVSQQDNDVYVITSDDGGSTFNPRQNITQYVRDQDGFRAYIDVSVLIRTDDEVSVAWGAREWPGTASIDATGAGLLRGRLFYWASDVGSIRTIYNGQWDQTNCNGGSWQLNFSKMQLGECDGKLYCLWVMFNDIPRGDTADCHARADDGDVFGSANGELFVSVSADNGLTWDESRNVTNSRSPGCDSATGAGGPCFSDHWPSMTRYGHAEAGGEDWSAATYVDVDGAYAGNQYLDVQYIQDGDPGGSVQTEGTWALSNVAWFRLACVEPVLAPQFSVNPTSIGFPNWTKHGVADNKTVDIENLGNANLSYSFNAVETAGPSGWLSTAGLSGNVPSGVGNVETATLTFNTGGVVNSPGTVVYLAGYIEFVHNAASSPDTLNLEYWVADTVIAPVFDTISTGATGISLVVNSAGNYGNQGTDSVNMDFHADPLECDSTANTYLYDGTPVVGWVDGSDTVMNWSIFGDGWLSDNGLRPRSHVGPTSESGLAGDSYEKYVASFFTNDSSVCLTRTWIAPTSGSGAGVSVGNYILQELTVTLCDTRTRTVLVGEAIDWDIPSDSAVDNGSGFDDTRGLIWQFGGEYNQDDTTECQDNDARYGALGYISGDQSGLSAYTADNATFVLGTGGFQAGQMYARMFGSVAFEVFSSTAPESTFVDLHSAMVYTKNASLAVGDTLKFVSVLITVRNGGDADVQAAYDAADDWYTQNIEGGSGGCCVGIRGDVNGDSVDADPIDLSYLVDALFAGGAPPPCPEEGDVNGDSVSADPIDLSYLVDALFAGGAPPPACP